MISFSIIYGINGTFYITFEHSKLKIRECLNVKKSHSFMPYFIGTAVL